jgi:hypothetical protein
MRQFYNMLALGYFLTATVFMMVLAALLLVSAAWEMVAALMHGEVLGVLESVGLVIVGFAIVETAKFIAEEELLRDSELRSAVESRRSLTKFVTIIVIAISLEALVMVFEAGRTEIRLALYPAALLVAAMLALMALGAYQWLSSRIAPPPPGPEGGTIDHEAPEDEAPRPASGERARTKPPRPSRRDL